MAPSGIRVNPVGVLIFGLVGLCVVFWMFDLPSWFRAEQRISMKELVSVSVELARRGGLKVKEVYDQGSLDGKVKGKTLEGAKEMLTQGDIKSHRAIVYGFSKAYPGLRIISEERETQPMDFHNIPNVDKNLEEVDKIITSDQSIPLSQITVWIDPLDATQEYTEGLTQYVTTMVCVVLNGEPTIGVINRPFLNETIWAWVGYGHSPNLKKTSEQEKDPEAPKTIIVSRSHEGAVRKVALKALGEKTKIVPAGGAGYKTMEVIKGNADAYLHVTLIKKWDICAGNAILSQVEGKMTTLEGNYIDYSPSKGAKNDKGLLATVSPDHYDLLKELAPAVEEVKKDEMATKH